MPHLQNTVPHSTPHVHDLHRTTTGCLWEVATASHSIRCSAVTLFLSFCCVLVDEHHHIVTVAMRPLRLSVSHGSRFSLPRPCMLVLPFSSSAKLRHGHCCETLQRVRGRTCLWIRASLHSLSQLPTMCLKCCHRHRLLHVFDCQSSCGHSVLSRAGALCRVFPLPYQSRGNRGHGTRGCFGSIADILPTASLTFI